MKLKHILPLLSCFILMVSLIACGASSSKSYTFHIDNGEKIKTTLETTDGYDLLQKDGTITVQKDGEKVLEGTFITADGYEQYAASIQSSEGVNIIEAVPADAPTFYLYQFEGAAGMETTFLFAIEGAETGGLFVSLGSMEEAKEAYGRLVFEKVE